MSRYSMPHADMVVMPAAPSAEKLLAATARWDLPPEVAEDILRQAVSEATRSTRRVQLRFAELAYAMGRVDLTDSLEVPDETRTWLKAQLHARRGELDEASRLLVELPPVVFPARLGIWASAATAMTVPVREQVLGELDAWTGVGPTQAAAVEVVRFALSEAAGDTDRHVATARHRIAAAAPNLHDRVLERVPGSRTPVAQLLRDIDQDPARLRESTELLEHAPLALIDDLIDEGIIGDDWLVDESAGEVSNYLAARLDPQRLDDDALERFGLDEEVARRAVRRGEPLPAGLPADITRRYELLAASTSGTLTTEAVVEVLQDHRGEEQQGLAHHLEQAISRPAAIPSDWLLQEPLARHVLARQAVDSLDLDALTRTGLSADQATFAGTVALERSRRALYAWHYEAAIDHAKACLRLCDEEALRDEALNLIAGASWQLGNDEDAIRALETALDGDYTFALQANIGLVAQELEPEVAARHLAKLIDDAPTLQMRVAAAKRTLAIWHVTELPDEQDNDLPTQVATALRDLLLEPLDPEDFRLFARLLADHDATWMATFESQAVAPHAGSNAAKLYTARARGMDDFISMLTQLLENDDEDWLIAERDRLVQAVIDALLADEPMVGAVSVGELMLEHRLPMDLADQIVLRGLMAHLVAVMVVDEKQGEPAIRFLDGLERDAALLDSLDEEHRHRAAKALEFGFEAITRAYLINRWVQLDEVAKFHDDVAAQIAYVPRRRRNHAQVQEAASNIESMAVDCSELFMRLRRNVTGELVDALDEAVAMCSKLVDAARDLPRI
jgi:tetratricopeptide (TPR) repeat protein